MALPSNQSHEGVMMQVVRNILSQKIMALRKQIPCNRDIYEMRRCSLVVEATKVCDDGNCPFPFTEISYFHCFSLCCGEAQEISAGAALLS